MLEYREIDFKEDVEEIVKLINENLDSGYTEAFFRWKHLDNPFGKSYGLLAVDSGEIIGLRMFMFWKFFMKKDNKFLTALRPVDTVVDEEYRGKGLFKKLTLSGLEACEGKYDLIFNTPNENSFPGYLKMGWDKIPANSFKLGLFNCFSIKAKTSGLTQFSSNLILHSNGWETCKSESFFNWRYKDSIYKAFSLDTANIIYSVNKRGCFKQIVIQEIFGEVKDMNLLVKTICRKHSTPFVYYYTNFQTQTLKPLYKKPRKQAIVVAKEDTFNITGNFNFSLGDLESKL